ncbi:hypothetical protein SEA_ONEIAGILLIAN_82 [Microbacterium phage OneinaGillian]|uniref:Uncharacterized protein n=1 Tax=Microbacterium phage OneinaGillian TaxID=2301604 RepID=A0A385UED7_9CAUD|nr:hypothetical protein HOU23_gp082 [Microbacterium phage OneinaGillian]AYB70192.1 hypothetical protein SEA_ONEIAGILLIAN_82 [Microbacterium phage OneinaGillian]QKO02835.1 hypothetical protein SEA_KELCOLE_83 [Microbacterium phage Kelcole]
MTDSYLSPYDTGKRAEPRPWTLSTKAAIAEMGPISRQFSEADFGKVDFENDSSEHVATVWFERGDDGAYVMHVAGIVGPVRIEVHND